MWKKTSFAATAAIVGPFTLWMFYVESTHEHVHKVNYPHMHVRNKAFPWKLYDCDLLDGDCKRAAKGGAAAAHH